MPEGPLRERAVMDLRPSQSLLLARQLVRPMIGLASLAALVSCGAERVLIVESSPSEALVRLDEEIIGVTPLAFPFDHYGDRRLSLYLDGFETWSEPIELKTPWYSRFPLDLLTEVLLPIHPVTHRTFTVTLLPTSDQVTMPDIHAFADAAHALHTRERDLGEQFLFQEILRRSMLEDPVALQALRSMRADLETRAAAGDNDASTALEILDAMPAPEVAPEEPEGDATEGNPDAEGGEPDGGGRP